MGAAMNWGDTVCIGLGVVTALEQTLHMFALDILGKTLGDSSTKSNEVPCGVDCC